MTKITSVLSGKGGTGKTFTVANLSLALQELGEQVVCIDTDINSANLATQLGHKPEGFTLDNVLKDEINALKAVSVHESGVMFIPASIPTTEEKISPDRLGKTIKNFAGFADQIIIDVPPGYDHGFHSSLEVSDEVLVVTNPEIQALQDSQKIVNKAEKNGTDVRGIILNKSTGILEEISEDEVEEKTDSQVLLNIPYREEILKSIHKKEPLTLDEHSPTGIQFKRLAAKISKKSYRPSWYSPIVRFASKIWGRK